MRAWVARRALSSASSAVVVTTCCKREVSVICTILRRALCEARTGTERHAGDCSALCSDRAATSRATGPAGIGAAPGSDARRLPGRERAGERAAAAGQRLAAAAPGRHAVHARVVRGAAAAGRPARAYPADQHRGVWSAGGAVAAADRLRMAHAPFR